MLYIYYVKYSINGTYPKQLFGRLGTTTFLGSVTMPEIDYLLNQPFILVLNTNLLE